MPHARRMTKALRTDFNDFLFARIADEASGMHLTLLSVLARSGIDPWAEAADLAGLPRESATQKLIDLLAKVPNGPKPGADAQTAASRLVALLHAAPKPPAPLVGAPRPLVAAVPMPKQVKVALYCLLALVAALLGNWALTDRQAPTPVESAVSAPG